MASTTRVSTVTVILSDDEAQTLVDILNRVGGSPEDSRRKFAAQILDSMESTGFKDSTDKEFGTRTDISGSVTFSSK